MGKCPSCGASSFFGVSTKQCAWCGRAICDRCVPAWHGHLSIKIHREIISEGRPYINAVYDTLGFCSDSCFYEFWRKAQSYAGDPVGTDVENFGKNWVQFWNDSILYAFMNSPRPNLDSITKIRQAIEIHAAPFVAIPWWDSYETRKPSWMAEYSSRQARTMLAQNLERCGRNLDAAKTYEQLRMYDQARQLREKEKKILVKRTDVSINLNALLNQIRDGGIVAVYRCPHCGGKLKIGKDTTTESLKVCPYCNSEIEAVDLADFFRTVLS